MSGEPWNSRCYLPISYFSEWVTMTSMASSSHRAQEGVMQEGAGVEALPDFS